MSDDFHAPEYRRRRQASMLFIALGALLIVGTSLWLWDSVRTLGLREAALADRINLLVERERTLAMQSDSTARTVTALSERQGDISARLDTLQGARRSALLAAEAEYLTRLAAQRLALAQDPAGARALLSAADESLREIRDADTHAVRAAVGADLARLQEASSLDLEAIYLRLDALPGRVDLIAGQAGSRAARQRGTGAVAGGAATPAPESAPVSGWERLGEEIRGLVNLRRADPQALPMVTPSERTLSAQNFRLLVEQAQLALLQRRGGIYRHSLEQAAAWLDRIVGGDPLLRNGVRRELASLAVVRLDGGGLDLSASLAATRALASRILPESQP